MRFQKIGMRLKNVRSKKRACRCEQGFWEYETKIVASSLLKSHSQVELNSTGTDWVVFNLATSGDLVASLFWPLHTRMGTLEENIS